MGVRLGPVPWPLSKAAKTCGVGQGSAGVGLEQGSEWPVWTGKSWAWSRGDAGKSYGQSENLKASNLQAHVNG